MSGEQTAESGGLKLPFPASLLSFLDRKPPGPRRTRRQPPDDGAAEETATAAAASASAAEEAGDQQQTPPQPPQFSQRPQRQRRKKRPAPSASESEGDEAGDEDDDDEAAFAAIAPAPKRAPVSLPPLSSLPLMPSPQQQPATTAATVATTTTAAPRRCKCKNSRCLKLYCECFRAGRHCGPDCECICCHNNLAHAAEVDRLRALALERNPAAFDPRDKVWMCFWRALFVV